MFIPRLLVLLLLVSLSLTPVAAQSSPDKNLVSPPTRLTLPQNAQTGIGINQLQQTLPLDKLNLSPATSGTIRTGGYEANLVAPPEFRAHPRAIPPSELALRTRTLVEQDTECLYIRSYRVTRDDPHSDSTRLAGYSECQPATRYQMKTAVQSLEIITR